MGTAWRAGRDLKRHDIGGKTGTTNSSKDAWFSGYGPDTVTSVWIGFDDHRRDLGRSTVSGAIPDQISGGEGGAKSAQPAWDDFMKTALEGIPEQKVTPPPGIISVTIDKSSGKLSGGGGGSRSEYFIEGTQPTDYPSRDTGTTLTDPGGESHELFLIEKAREIWPFLFGAKRISAKRAKMPLRNSALTLRASRKIRFRQQRHHVGDRPTHLRQGLRLPFQALRIEIVRQHDIHFAGKVRGRHRQLAEKIEALRAVSHLFHQLAVGGLQHPSPGSISPFGNPSS